MRKKQLLEQLAALRTKKRDHEQRLELAATTGDPVKPEDVQALHQMDNDEAALQAELKSIEELEARVKARATEVRELATTRNNAQDRPWSGLGEFLGAVVRAGSPGREHDPRLYQLAPSGAGETVPADGGFLVGTQYSTELMRRAYDVSQVANRCRRIPIGAGANRFSVPYVDETSRATGSRWGGVQVYRAAEADTVTASKPKFGRLEIALEKLMGIAYATDEMVADSTQLEAVFTQAFSEEMGFVLDDEIIRGNGVAKCLGVMTSGALVTVSKEGSQAADTVLFANVLKMWSRLWARSRSNAVWYINQDVEPQLAQMTVNVKNVAGTENVGGSAVYVPPSGATGSPYATLFTRPVVPIEQAATIGDLGDIILMDPSQYILIEKGGVQGAASMHVRFLYDEMTFRWTYRINGAPAWKSALTPYKGSNTQSPFITLEAR